MRYQLEEYMAYSSSAPPPANDAVDNTQHESQSEETKEMDGVASDKNGELPVQNQLDGEKDTECSQNDENGVPPERGTVEEMGMGEETNYSPRVI